MWIPLHVHSQYSVLDASASVERIAARAALYGMPACALTDHGNLFGAIDFYSACKKKGVKPIIGCELYIAPRSRLEKQKARGEKAAYHLTCLAMNQTGYQNLCKLTSAGYIEGFYYHPRVDHELLEKHSKGLIVLSGCMSSPLSQAILSQSGEELKVLEWYKRVFGDRFYIEIQRHAMDEETIEKDGMKKESWLLQQYQDFIQQQERLNQRLIALSKEHSIPLVATNDSHYIDREEWQAHEILLNIQSGEPCEIWERDAKGVPTFRRPNPKRRVYSTHEFDFKSPEKINALFADLPEAVENTLVVANRCDLQLNFQAKHYPVFVPPDIEGKKYNEEERQERVKEYLWELCKEGISHRYTPERLSHVAAVYPGKDPMEVVEERLAMEMGIIAPKGMCDYLLIVWDFIHWAKKSGIPMGPGRGSGAGSIVLYLIGITDIEPLRFHLFFERFINPERLSYPDIDVDICMERRGEVIQYTLEKYGADNVAQIITFGTMKAKMVVRDVGRVLSVPLSKVNLIAKLIPEELSMTLEAALEQDPDFKKMYDQDEETRRVVDLGRKIEGAIRSTGIHAAGVIISGAPLTDLIPICNAKDSEMPVTQYSMKPVEKVGMLKMDFLGLKTLTAIQACIKALKEDKGIAIDWMNLPLDDQKTFSLLNQGKTLGVFQLESGGMQDLARGLHLDKFEEIFAVNALYRPGPMDMIPSFIQRKHGTEPIEYDHPWMEDILSETYGIMVYQEQVMQIAQKLAGYSLGEGDVLRRAMGKKDAAQMAQEREKFKSGALKNGITEEVGTAIFDKMEKFASYGFNKSHAAAYGYLSYVTAYLKANYPNEWMAALMTCDFSDQSKLAKFIREAKSMGIAILSPGVNEADVVFRATDEGVRFAMSGIRGVGSAVVEAIVKERERGGLFTSYYNFFTRIDPKKVGKKMIENLVAAGAFDFTGWTRDALILSIEPMFETAVRERKEKEAGVQDLFALSVESSASLFSKPPKVEVPTSEKLRLLKEKEMLGFFLTGHPMDGYEKLLKRLSCVPLKAIDTLGKQAVFRSALIIESVTTRFSSKTQKKFAILTVSDGIVNYELPIWPDLYENASSLLQENQLVYAVLQVENEGGTPRLSCRWLADLDAADEQTITECDAVYDKVKLQIKRGPWKKRMPKEKEEKKVEPEDIILTLQVSETKFSHILDLKEKCKLHNGEHPLKIVFFDGEKKLATVHASDVFKIKSNKIFTLK